MSGVHGIRAIADLYKICRREKVDVIHAQGPREAFLSAALKITGLHLGVAYSVHFSSLQPLRWRLINKIVSTIVDSVISVCKNSVPVLLKNGVSEDKIEIIENGVKSGWKTEREKITSDIVFVTVARFSKEKGLSFLIDSLSELKRKTPVSFTAYIVGDGPLFEEIAEEVKNKGFEKNVICTGYKENVRDYLRMADVYLLPSESEALSIAALEAISEGVPVVATDVGGNREIVCENGECGFVSPFGDTVAFSENVNRLLLDEELRGDFSVKAKLKAKEVFSVERQVYKTYEVYEKIRKRKRGKND